MPVVPSCARRLITWWCLLAAAVLCGRADAGTRFAVSFDASLRAEPASGRLVIYMIRPGDMAVGRAEPGDAPFFDNPQPCFGVSVTGLAPGRPVIVDDGATSYPCVLSKLPKGNYRVQAVLDVNRQSSDWHVEPGNLYSEVQRVDINMGKPDAPVVEIRLTKATSPRVPANSDACELFRVRSELLSSFHGRDVYLRAGVVFPIARAAGTPCAAVYEIPGFGGDARMAFGIARSRGAYLGAGAGQRSPGGDDPNYAGMRELWSHTFHIVLDADSGNGHTLWADSANNGPWEQALTTELIPAMEKRYHLIARPEARLLTGHSSGGWSALWLQLRHPGYFGGAWPSSPDPVDFRRFQRTDIYSSPSMYDESGDDGTTRDTPSFRASFGKVRMTVRTENAIEEVLGPGNTSAQQWDSWQAVFGPRDAGGNPAALFDPVSGAIDRSVAERFREYDIADMLRKDPARYAPVLRGKVRLIVGDRDGFFLNEAVSLLKESLDSVSPPEASIGAPGYIRVLPGDHGSVMSTPEARGRWLEMLDHLKLSGVLAP